MSALRACRRHPPKLVLTINTYGNHEGDGRPGKSRGGVPMKRRGTTVNGMAIKKGTRSPACKRESEGSVSGKCAHGALAASREREGGAQSPHAVRSRSLVALFPVFVRSRGAWNGVICPETSEREEDEGRGSLFLPWLSTGCPGGCIGDRHPKVAVNDPVVEQVPELANAMNDAGLSN